MIESRESTHPVHPSLRLQIRRWPRYLPATFGCGGCCERELHQCPVTQDALLRRRRRKLWTAPDLPAAAQSRGHGHLTRAAQTRGARVSTILLELPKAAAHQIESLLACLLSQPLTAMLADSIASDRQSDTHGSVDSEWAYTPGYCPSDRRSQ